MRIPSVAVLLGVAVMGSAVPAFADSITVVSVTRTVLAQAAAGSDSRQTTDSNHDFLGVTATASAGASAVTAGASLDTTESLPDDFVAIGNTFINRTGSDALTSGIANSTFRVQFDANEWVRYLFGATFMGLGNDELHHSIWSADLVSDTTGTLMFRFAGGGVSGPVLDGLLSPGRYSFTAIAVSNASEHMASGSTAGGFNVALGFEPAAAPTPEPASMLLLGTGVAGLVARRRARRIGADRVTPRSSAISSTV